MENFNKKLSLRKFNELLEIKICYLKLITHLIGITIRQTQQETENENSKINGKSKLKHADKERTKITEQWNMIKYTNIYIIGVIRVRRQNVEDKKYVKRKRPGIPPN